MALRVAKLGTTTPALMEFRKRQPEFLFPLTDPRHLCCVPARQIPHRQADLAAQHHSDDDDDDDNMKMLMMKSMTMFMVMIKEWRIFSTKLTS